MQATHHFIKIIALDWSYTVYNPESNRLYNPKKLRQFCLDAEKSGRKVVIISTIHQARTEIQHVLNSTFGRDRTFLVDADIYAFDIIKQRTKQGVKFEHHRTKLTLLNLIREDYRVQNNGKLISTSQVIYCDDDAVQREKAREKGYFVIEFDSVDARFLAMVSTFIANKESIHSNEAILLQRSGHHYKPLVADYNLFDEINCVITNFMQNSQLYTDIMHDLKSRHTMLSTALLKKAAIYEKCLQEILLPEQGELRHNPLPPAMLDTNGITTLNGAEQSFLEFQRTTTKNLLNTRNAIRILHQRADDEKAYEEFEHTEIEKLEILLKNDSDLWKRSLDEMDMRLQELKSRHAIQNEIAHNRISSQYERKVASELCNQIQTQINSYQKSINNQKEIISIMTDMKQKEIYNRGQRLAQLKLTDADVLYNVYHHVGATCNRNETGKLAKTLIDYLDAFLKFQMTPSTVKDNHVRLTKALIELYAAINWAAKSLIYLTDPQGGIDRNVNSVQQAIANGQRLAETRDRLNLSSQYDLFKLCLAGILPLIDNLLRLIDINKRSLVPPGPNRAWDSSSSSSSSTSVNTSSSFWDSPIKEYQKKLQGYESTINKFTEFKERIVKYSDGLENLSVDQIYEHNQMLGRNPTLVVTSNKFITDDFSLSSSPPKTIPSITDDPDLDVEQEIHSTDSSGDRGKDFKSLETEDDSSRINNNAWYSDTTINRLLEHYIWLRNTDCQALDAARLTCMLGTNLNRGNDLTDNLVEYQIQRALKLSQFQAVENQIIIPVNLDRQHWVLLHIVYLNRAIQPISIRYFDPLGHGIPDVIKAGLNRADLFPDVVPESENIRLQFDGQNCGPWIIEAARAYLNGSPFPTANYDISQARLEHTAIRLTQDLTQVAQNNIRLGAHS